MSEQSGFCTLSPFSQAAENATKTIGLGCGGFSASGGTGGSDLTKPEKAHSGRRRRKEKGGRRKEKEKEKENS